KTCCRSAMQPVFNGFCMSDAAFQPASMEYGDCPMTTGRIDVMISGFMQESTPITTLRTRVTIGLQPWLAGFAPLMSLAHLILEAGFNFLPVTYVLLIPKLGLTYGQIGTLVLMSSLAGTITQPLFGWLSDRGDPRVIVVGSLIWGGS